MAAGLAHELNNPLTGITVYSELLKENISSDDPAQGDLDCIIEDVDRCKEIVKGLLDYSRQSLICVGELDLTQVVEDAFHLIRDDAVFLHVEVERDYHKAPVPVQGDEKLMRQVFVNLLMNAVDAMEGHGKLTVRTGIDPADDFRWVEVSDNGPGIAPENVERVFDPFFTTKEVGKGTGLGLSVVYGVVSRHGGTISVKETGSQGTTFLVRFPYRVPEELMALARVTAHRSKDGE